jgi:hypothetical protein
MVLLGDEAKVKAHFSSFGDSVYLDARLVHSLRRTCHRLRNHFGRTRQNSLVTWVIWNFTCFSLEIVFILVQDR